MAEKRPATMDDMARIGGVGQPDLVVLVVGGAGPEPYRLDRRIVGAVLALGGEPGLARVDPGLVIGAFDAGNAVQRIVLGHRGADEAAVEDVGTAD